MGTRSGPSPAITSGIAAGGLWCSTSRRRRAVTAFLRLCQDADVVVETFSPGTMARLGLSYSGVSSQRSPRLVFCSVPGLPARPPLRRPPRLGRHGPGPLRYAERAARLAARPRVPPFPRPEHGGLLPPGFRGALGAGPPRGDRARAARPRRPCTRESSPTPRRSGRSTSTPPAGFRSTMAKTYPPGIHQTSLFECADGEWIHAATMNGTHRHAHARGDPGPGPGGPARPVRRPGAAGGHEARLRAAYRQRPPRRAHRGVP